MREQKVLSITICYKALQLQLIESTRKLIFFTPTYLHTLLLIHVKTILFFFVYICIIF